MIGRTNAGGGSGKLDFRVISGLAAPANPRRNDIWVKSDIPVTQVLVSEADGWETVRGAVNLRFNVKPYSDAKDIAFGGKLHGIDHQIWASPTYCRISDGTKLRQVDAYIYQSGEWQQFASARTYLFSAHDQHDAITGGWSSDGYRQTAASKSGGAGYDGPSIYCTGKSGNYEGANGTGLAIDMRSFNTLYVDGVAASTSNAFVFVVTQKNPFQDNYVAINTLNTTRSVIAVDVSNVSSGYIVFTSFSGKNETSRVYNMWLE